MGFRHIGLCVLTVWASVGDPVSIGDQHLFKTQHYNTDIRTPGIYLRPGV